MKTEMNTVKVRKTEELEAEQLGAHIGCMEAFTKSEK